MFLRPLPQFKLKDGVKTKPIVKRTEEILLSYEQKENENGFTPYILFSICALLILLITYKDYKKKKRTKLLDAVYFLDYRNHRDSIALTLVCHGSFSDCE